MLVWRILSDCFDGFVTPFLASFVISLRIMSDTEDESVVLHGVRVLRGVFGTSNPMQDLPRLFRGFTRGCTIFAIPYCAEVRVRVRVRVRLSW